MFNLTDFLFNFINKYNNIIYNLLYIIYKILENYLNEIKIF